MDSNWTHCHRLLADASTTAFAQNVWQGKHQRHQPWSRNILSRSRDRFWCNVCPWLKSHQKWRFLYEDGCFLIGNTTILVVDGKQPRLFFESAAFLGCSVEPYWERSLFSCLVKNEHRPTSPGCLHKAKAWTVQCSILSCHGHNGIYHQHLEQDQEILISQGARICERSLLPHDACFHLRAGLRRMLVQ